MKNSAGKTICRADEQEKMWRLGSKESSPHKIRFLSDGSTEVADKVT